MAEMRFTISNKTEELVKKISDRFGLEKTEIGRIALIEYIMRFEHEK